MLEQIRTVDGEALLPLPADVLAAIGFQPGDQVEVTVMGQSGAFCITPRKGAFQIETGETH